MRRGREPEREREREREVRVGEKRGFDFVRWLEEGFEIGVA
jgi:hypothetical protein